MNASFPAMRCTWLGRIGYPEALSLQRALFDRRKAGTVSDTVLLLEHEPVYTLGRRATGDDVLADEATLRSLGAEVAETDRGGEVTYHGPGQLVMYPVMSIREAGLGPVTYVRILEQVVIDTLHKYGIEGHRVVGKTGVWVGGQPGSRPKSGQNPSGRKIAAMGVRVSSGIAMHGLALNVSTQLSYFDHIVPCGMPSLAVTSIASEAHSTAMKTVPEVAEVAEMTADRLAHHLQRSLRRVEPSDLLA